MDHATAALTRPWEFVNLGYLVNVPSTGNTVTLTGSTGTTGGYRIFVDNAGASTAVSATAQMAYRSLLGGLDTAIAGTACA